MTILTVTARHLKVLTEVSDKVALLAGDLYHDARLEVLSPMEKIVEVDVEIAKRGSWSDAERQTEGDTPFGLELFAKGSSDVR